jgi:hypothetical protein
MHAAATAASTTSQVRLYKGLRDDVFSCKVISKIAAGQHGIFQYRGE